jgi:dihydropteroate synthase
VSDFRLMGVVNVTPDSFSDGGLFFEPGAAVAHGLQMASEGADILDVGGESTRPGAEPVPEARELQRVLPVIEGLAAALEGTALVTRGASAGAPARWQISIDTSKAAVARAALAGGASLVNDVTALRGDPEMAGVIAESGAECCLMHMRGEPRTMQLQPRYEDVVDDVKAFLVERLEFAVREGVAEERVLLDPGIGFGKTVQHNLELLRRLDELAEIGRPLLVGTSRKTFLGRLLADAEGASDPVDVAERLPGTLATCVLAYERGGSVFRVHDIAPTRAALVTAAATLGARWTTT